MSRLPLRASKRHVAMTAVSLIVLMMATIPSSKIWAEPGSLSVHGHLTSQSVTGPECTSPVGVCATGTLHGSLNGPFEFVASSIVSADQPGVVFLKGVTVIHDQHGEMQCADSAAFNTTRGSDGELVGLCEITGLTGQWTGASGYLQSAGTFTLEAGGTEQYFGKIVLPKLYRDVKTDG
jgi:hypothetical protein